MNNILQNNSNCKKDSSMEKYNKNKNKINKRVS